MAEVTKRKLTAIYSMIVGFFLSLFSGHAHGGQLFYARKTEGVNKTTSVTKTNTLKISPSTGREFAPAPTTTTSIEPTTGKEFSPAPDSSLSVESKNAESVEDVGMRNFMVQKAVEQGKSPQNLSEQEFNSLRTDYLVQQVKTLEQQIQQLNEQNLSH